MASPGFFSIKRHAARGQQPKETPTTFYAPLVGPERPVGDQDESTDDESFILILSPEANLGLLTPQPPTHAGEAGTKVGATSHDTLSHDWEEVRDPTHLIHNTSPNMENSGSSTRQASNPDARVERQEPDPMSSGTLFDGPADLRDPTYLTRPSKDQEDSPVGDDLDLMSSGVMFRTVKELRDPTALQKIALARAAAQSDRSRAQR
ncbi:hypothetical protein RB595_005910 [Gaeumannomyces hyphopodioides]